MGQSKIIDTLEMYHGLCRTQMVGGAHDSWPRCGVDGQQGGGVASEGAVGPLFFGVIRPSLRRAGGVAPDLVMTRVERGDSMTGGSTASSSSMRSRRSSP